VSVPNWKVNVVGAPAPMVAVLLAMPPVLRLCDCANWVTLILYLPGTAPAPALALRTSLLLGKALRPWKVAGTLSLLMAPWNDPTAAVTWPNAALRACRAAVFFSKLTRGAASACINCATKALTSSATLFLQ